MAVVFASLLAICVLVRAPLDEIANPGRRQLHPAARVVFPVAVPDAEVFSRAARAARDQVIPGLAVGFLALLPFLDRKSERRPWARARLPYTVGLALLVGGVTGLTFLGLQDRPQGKKAERLGPAADRRPGAGDRRQQPLPPLPRRRAAPPRRWSPPASGVTRSGCSNHMIDPVAIAPGVRTEQDRAPRSAMGRFGAQAVVAYLRRSHAGIAPPPLDRRSIRLAAMTYASTCVVCHRISGEGGTVGPDLTHGWPAPRRRGHPRGHRGCVDGLRRVVDAQLQGQADRRANRGAGRLSREPEVAHSARPAAGRTSAASAP